jgi:hypothetical protein
MTQLSYHASQARLDDLLREAEERRRATQAPSSRRRTPWILRVVSAR